MREVLKVALAQYEPVNGHPEINGEKILSLTKDAAQRGANLVCFSELFYSGYDVDKETLARCAISTDGEFFRLVKECAKQNKINVMFSYPEKEKGTEKPYISFAHIDASGELIGNHRKTYLWLEENDKATPGAPVYEPIETRFGTMGSLICYEIEFPEPARILTLNGAEIIVVASVFANIPNLEKYLGGIAIQNLAYVIGINSVKVNQEPHRGGSRVVDQMGKTLCLIEPGVEGMEICEINLNKDNRRDAEPHMQDLIIDTTKQIGKVERWK